MLKDTVPASQKTPRTC